MKENDVEKLVKEVSEHRQVPPPADAWQRIEQRLDAAPMPPSPTRAVGWKGELGAVMVAVALIVGGIALVRHTPEPTAAAGEVVAAAALPDREELPASEAASAVVAPAPAGTAAPTPAMQGDAAEDVAIPVVASGTQWQPMEEPPAPVASPAAEEPVSCCSQPQTSPPAGTPAMASAAVVSQPQSRTVQPPAPVAPDPEPAAPASPRPLPIDSLLPCVPNLITPNNDGVNDRWEIRCADTYGPLQVQIYNARGQRVYSNDNYHDEFDGANLPNGNYFYVLQLRGHGAVRRGVLVIKR